MLLSGPPGASPSAAHTQPLLLQNSSTLAAAAAPACSPMAYYCAVKTTRQRLQGTSYVQQTLLGCNRLTTSFSSCASLLLSGPAGADSACLAFSCSSPASFAVGEISCRPAAAAAGSDARLLQQLLHLESFNSSRMEACKRTEASIMVPSSEGNVENRHCARVALLGRLACAAGVHAHYHVHAGCPYAVCQAVSAP